MRDAIRALVILGALVAVCREVNADEVVRGADSDSNIVLEYGDSVVVNRNRVSRYECAEGVLVAYDWGSRLKLRCEDSLDARAVGRGVF